MVGGVTSSTTYPTATPAASLGRDDSQPPTPPIVTAIGTPDPPEPSNNSSDSTLAKSIKTVKEFTKKYSPHLAWASLLTGLGNFAYINIKDAESRIANITTIALSKASLFVNGTYALLQSIEKKNTITAIGYASDLVTSIKSDSKNMYFFRFFGTALDQFSGLMEDFSVKYPDLIQEKYNETSEQFIQYKDFTNNLNKSWTATKQVFTQTLSEIKTTYKEKGIFVAIKDYFGKNRADANILGSSIGVLASGAIGIIGKIYEQVIVEKLGKTLRVFEGFHCDYGIWLKKFSKDPRTGQPSSKGNGYYADSGLVYAIAGVLDLANTWLSEKGFHFASVGLDRFAAYLLARAQTEAS